MKKEDFVIQSEVRRLLVRSNIDYTKIDFGTVKGVVYFRGFFQIPMALECHEEAKRMGTAKALSSFEKKVRAIPGVVDVVFQLTNWFKERGQWIPTQPLKEEEKRVKEGLISESTKEGEGKKTGES